MSSSSSFLQPQHAIKVEVEKRERTYPLIAPPTFQLCCLRIFAAVVLSDCVTDVNSLIALFCCAVYAAGIVGG